MLLRLARQDPGSSLPFYIRAGHDGTGTAAPLKPSPPACAGVRFANHWICRGDFDPVFLAQCQELGLTLAVSLDLGVV